MSANDLKNVKKDTEYSLSAVPKSALAKAGVANRATRMAAANGAGLRIMRTPSAGSGTGLCAGHLPVALQHPRSGGSRVLRHNITSIIR